MNVSVDQVYRAARASAGFALATGAFLWANVPWMAATMALLSIMTSLIAAATIVGAAIKDGK